jgi:asparaginyl-tRNA synthetase
MKNSVKIDELKNHVGETVTVHGWLEGKRSGGKLVFLQVRDGTGFCQGVVEASSQAAFEEAEKLQQESSLALTGEVRQDERAPGSFEISVSGLQVLHQAEEYPVTRKSHGIDFLMAHRHLWLRSRRPWSILRIRHTIIKACRDFFDRKGFTLIDTPILVAGAGEDAQTLFPVEYFEDRAYLSQTGQLYLESACMALDKVYCFGPTFRAEKSKTRRHLTEFWMVEPEVAFAELDDILGLAEEMICSVIEAVLENHPGDLESLERDITSLQNISTPFPRITYSDAVELLHGDSTSDQINERLTSARQELDHSVGELAELERKLNEVSKPSKRENLSLRIRELRARITELERETENLPKHLELAKNFQWGADLGGSDETIISRNFQKPVFVTHYPKKAKAFYMKTAPSDPRTVLNMDLLAPEGYGEIIGGSQREENLEALSRRMKEKKLNPDDYKWYLDLRRYGSVPHGGFGLGIERLLCWICGLKHVREAIPFPRTMGRIYP